MPRFPLADWQAQQTRVTVFSMNDASAALQQWWHDVISSEPDDITVNPKKHSGSVQGTYGTGRLVLGTEPGRIDWLLLPAERSVEESMTTGELPVIGGAVETTETFSAIVERWLSLEGLPVVGRMAFGAALVHPEANRNEAYERISDYLPVQMPPGSSDFLFQINRPQPSTTGLGGLVINRLTKWGVALLKVSPAGVIPDAPQVFNLRVELDINTAPTFTGPIPQERLIEVYRELVSEGMRIAADGVPTL